MKDREYQALHWAVILATPFLILAIHPNLFINPNTNVWIDSWVNTGFFLSLRDHLARWGGTYYSTRLSWLLPGFAVHQLFSPLLANYVLHLGYFYVLLFSLYALVTSGVDRTTAMIVTLLVAWHPELLAAMSWDYVDGAVITYFVVTLLCLEKASRSSRWSLWAAGGGAGLACVATANLVGVTLWPLCGLFLLLRVGFDRWRRTLAILAVSALGALAVFAILGVANQQLGGRFVFLAASLDYAKNRMWLPSPWEAAGTTWLPRAMFLVLPAVAALGAVLALLRRAGTRSFAGAVQLTLLVAVAWWMIHSTLWTHSVHIPYYTSYLIPLAVLALAIHPDSPVNGAATLRPGGAIALTLGILGGLIVQFLTVRKGEFVWTTVLPERLGPFSTPYGFNAFVAFGIAALALISLRFVRTPWYRWPAFLVVLLMVYSSVPMHWATTDTPHLQEDFEVTASAHRFINQHLDRTRRLRVWYTLTPGESRPFRNISSTYLWGWSIVNESMPTLEPAQAASLNLDSQLMVMAADRSEIDAARRVLEKAGLDYAPRAQQEFGIPGSTFWVLIGDVSTVRSEAR